MSKADKMFEKLGYKKIQNKECIWYQKKITNYIFKNILIMTDEKEIYVEISYYGKNNCLLKKESFIIAKELQAINEKVKELGWNEF